MFWSLRAPHPRYGYFLIKYKIVQILKNNSSRDYENPIFRNSTNVIYYNKFLPGNGVKLAKSVKDFSRLCLCQKSIPSAWKQTHEQLVSKSYET